MNFERNNTYIARIIDNTVAKELKAKIKNKKQETKST